MAGWLCAVFALPMSAQTASGGLDAGVEAMAGLDLSACAFPDTPALPDGNLATGEEMATAGAAVKDFVTNGQDQLGCLENLQASLGDTITEEQKATIVDTYNGGVDQLNAVAGAYNEAVRAFKARTTPDE